MPFERLQVHITISGGHLRFARHAADLSKLHDCPDLTDVSPRAENKGLTGLTLPSKAKNFEFLRAFPKLERIGFKEDSSANGWRPLKTAAEFWKEYDAKKK